jgi:hypothetical protein
VRGTADSCTRVFVLPGIGPGTGLEGGGTPASSNCQSPRLSDVIPKTLLVSPTLAPVEPLGHPVLDLPRVQRTRRARASQGRSTCTASNGARTAGRFRSPRASCNLSGVGDSEPVSTPMAGLPPGWPQQPGDHTSKLRLLEIAACRLAADPRLVFDPPERPARPPKCLYRLLFLSA